MVPLSCMFKAQTYSFCTDVDINTSISYKAIKKKRSLQHRICVCLAHYSTFPNLLNVCIYFMCVCVCVWTTRVGSLPAVPYGWHSA